MANISDFISAGGGGGGGFTPVLANVENQTYNASTNEFYIVTAAGITINLPQNPSIGDAVKIHNRATGGNTVRIHTFTNSIFDPVSSTTIVGNLVVEDTASYELTYEGTSWSLIYSGYFVGTPSATSGLSLGFDAQANTTANIALSFFLRSSIMPAPGTPVTLPLGNIRTDQTLRVQAVVTDPDSPGTPIITWADQATLTGAGSTLVVSAGGRSGQVGESDVDDFIEFTNPVENNVVLNPVVSALDTSGGVTADNSLALTYLNNQSPTSITLTSGIGNAEADENIRTEIVSLVDPDAPNPFPHADFTYDWTTPAGTDIEVGCGTTDTFCELSSTGDAVLAGAELTVTATDAGGAQITSSARTLNWRFSAPAITSGTQNNTNSGSFTHTITQSASAIAAGAIAQYSTDNGVTFIDGTSVTSSLTTTCPDSATARVIARSILRGTGGGADVTSATATGTFTISPRTFGGTFIRQTPSSGISVGTWSSGANANAIANYNARRDACSAAVLPFTGTNPRVNFTIQVQDRLTGAREYITGGASGTITLRGGESGPWAPSNTTTGRGAVSTASTTFTPATTSIVVADVASVTGLNSFIVTATPATAVGGPTVARGNSISVTKGVNITGTQGTATVTLNNIGDGGTLPRGVTATSTVAGTTQTTVYTVDPSFTGTSFTANGVKSWNVSSNGFNATNQIEQGGSITITVT